MNIFQAGGATPLESVDLGKPAPNADGMIRVDFISLLPVPLTPGLFYEATISAVGPGGVSPSPRSNAFGLSQTCSFSLSPSSQSFGSGGGTGAFNVTTDVTCQWTTVSQVPWLTVTSGASGMGSGTVSYTAAANTGASIRSGVLVAADWNFTVTEAGQTSQCGFAVTPASTTTSSSAVTLSFTVSTASGCAWTSESGASWAVVKSGASGSGPGTVTVSVARNVGASRSTTLTIAGGSVGLTQQAKKGNR